MTSDAKVGLLLGLVFIVIIAFLMNGLPGLLTRNTSDLVTTVTGNQTRALRLDANADDAVRRVHEEMINMPFPSRRINIEQNRQTDRRFASRGNTGADTSITKNFDNKRKNSKVRIYTVKDGDNLAKIAKNIYGDQVGNKNATIRKIFEANKDIMNTPDRISVGQKLRIPALHTPDNTAARQNLESTGLFDRVRDTFNNIVNQQTAKKRANIYIVKDGDSLWKIADRLFSDGARFVDIAKLNRNIIPDGETLSIGMKLKLPQ